MKRSLFSILAILVVLSMVVVACGPTAAPTAAPTAEATAPPETKPTEVVVPPPEGVKIVVIGKSVHPYWSNVEKGVIAAGKDLGVETVFFVPPKEDVAAQTQTMETYIAQGVTGIAIAPSDPNALESVMKKAADAGIFVTTLDTPPVENSVSLVYIGTDNYSAGKMAGETMAGLLPGGGKVGIGRGSDTALNALQRTDGFLEGIAGTAIEALEPVNDKEDAATALQLANSVLSANPDLAGAFGVYAYNGPAWATAIKEANAVGKVKLVSFDATTDIINGIKEGVIDATVAQREYDMGYKSVEIIKLMAEKGTDAALSEMGAVDGIIDTGVDVITAATLKEYEAGLDAKGIPHEWNTEGWEPSEAPAAGEGVYGGVLRIIAATGPQVLSYPAMMGPGDRSAIFPGAEALVDTTAERGEFTAGVEPVLAESVDVDVENLTITFHIRKGVKFHDGSDLTAEVAAWNLQQVIDAGAMPYMDYFKEMRVEDDYTLVIELTKYNNQLMPTWGWWTAQYSKEAWEAGGTTDEERIDWARTHMVGTGPFVLEEFERDVSLKWVKNENYWREGRPYLDGIEVTIIPDPVTARALMEAGDAENWGGPAKDAVEMEEMGYTIQSDWPVLPMGLWINTAHPDSIFQDIRLREAVEYALDKAAIAQAIGHGLYQPIKSLPIEGEWGYDPDRGRDYDPDKARELLADAGYSTDNPLKVQLLSMNDPTTQDVVTMIKSQLDAVGFDVELDLADYGRFSGTVYWLMPDDLGPEPDLSWWLAGGMDSNYLQTYIRWFSTEPFSWLSYLGRTEEQTEMDKQAMAAVDIEEQVEWAGKLMDYMSENALIIPVYGSTAYTIQQPYVHSGQYTQGFVRWQTEEVWLEPH